MKPVPAYFGRLLPRYVVVTLLLAAGAASALAAGDKDVLLVIDDAESRPVQHGVEQLRLALRQRGALLKQATFFEKAGRDTVVLAGLMNGRGDAAKLAAELGLTAADEPESLCVRTLSRDGKAVILVTASDARGLMYGLLDVADRVRWAGTDESTFSQVRDVQEKPYTAERALSIYTFNRAYWESRFYDGAYWARYLDLLARNRFNSLVVIFGYENGGFLAPCYPYFFNLDEYPDVRMVGITPDQQQRNLAALNRLIQMAHDRGLKFTVGIWDHIYRGGVQGGGIPGADEGTRKPLPGLVWGVTADNLVPYTKAALAEFVRRVPALDGIQFRMHDESGLKKTEQEAFWRDVFQMMRKAAPTLRLDLRAKGLPDSVIQSAIDLGVPFRITTKYWMEQMGLPFHPTHINTQNQFDRRHSYADLLSYPQRYKMHWRLWNGGTARVLLWGDPEYARRFAESTHLYGGDGFEVNEPLCTKMEAQPHDARPFQLMPEAHRYYDYEFERYWHFFQVFGRIGYNTNTPPEVWDREFEKRFGKEAAPFLERGLHAGSRVLPRIVASCYPYGAFPMTRGWAEKQPLGTLPAYAKAQGSDIQQFANFDEEAQVLLGDGETAKLRPGANSAWFAKTADIIEMQIAEAEKRIGSSRDKEFESTVTDLKILAKLARFHSRRIPAAVSYRLFERTKDPQALDDAIVSERGAIDAWRQLVLAAADYYTYDLMMGVRGADLCGHWRDELPRLETGLKGLESLRRTLEPGEKTRPAPRYFVAATSAESQRPTVTHQHVLTAAASEPLAITVEIHAPGGVKWVRLRYRSVNQQEDYRTLPMLPIREGDHYKAVIPAEHMNPRWDLMYFIEIMSNQGVGTIYPDLEKETPYVIVKLQRAEALATLQLPPHPRLLLNRADLPAIRARAAGEDKAYYQTLRDQADEWLSREVKLPDRGGQWFHWYSCPKHGARLRTEGPRRHVCPVDQEVFTGYPYDDVVLSSEHNRLAGAIRTLGLVYQVGGDSRHAAKAKEILLAYAEKYQSYPLHDIRGQAKVGGAKVGPQTLDESTWLITLVEGADCIWDTLTPQEQQKVKEGLLVPATDVIRQHKMPIHNIQCWKNSAVGLTGLLLGDMDLVREALHGPAGYYNQMAKGVSADGPWFEGAWGYHFYTLNALLHLTEGASHSGMNLYGPELKRMFDAPLAMAMPDLSLPAFNDSGRVDLSREASLYETAFARYHDPQYLLVTRRSSRGNESAWLHGTDKHRPARGLEPISRNFSASGNAILAAGAGSNATWICMKYGPHGGGHGHPDKLNFVLYGLGQVIALDPGTANYGVPIQGGWFRTTLAHNTLSVDEKSQRPAEGRCETFVTTNGFSAVMAEAGNIYDGVKFYRTMALIGTELVVVLDQIQSERSHVYDLAYHNRGWLAPADGTDFEPPAKPGYSYLRDLRARISSSPVRLRFELPGGKPVWWALAGGEPTTILTGTGVGRHTEDRVPLVIARRDRKATSYLWCVYLGPDGDRLEVKPEEARLPDGSLPEEGTTAAVRVTAGSQIHVIVANPGGGSVMVRKQKVDGRIAWLTQGDDGLLRVSHSAR